MLNKIFGGIAIILVFLCSFTWVSGVWFEDLFPEDFFYKLVISLVILTFGTIIASVISLVMEKDK